MKHFSRKDKAVATTARPCYIPRMRKLHFFTIIFAFLSFSIAAQQTLQVKPDRYDGFYHKGETVIFRVSGGSGVADYVVSKDGVGTLSSGSISLGDKPAEIKASLDEPGVIHCDVTPRSNPTTKPVTGGAAVDP